MKSKGIYIIEDANTSYIAEYGGGGCGSLSSTVEFFKGKIDDVFLRGCRLLGRKVRTYADRDFLLSSKVREFTEYEKSIESVHFYSGLIMVFKQ